MLNNSPARRTRRSATRLLLSGVAFAAVATVMVGCAADGADSGDGSLSGQVIFADYGGPTNESRQISYFDSFSEDTGVEVVSASLEDAIANEMLAGGEGDYDLIQVSSDTFLAHQDNLVALPADGTVPDNLPEEIQGYAVGGFTIGITQGWLTETFPNGGPEDWADFFDLEAFPGSRAWPGSPGSYDASYELALLADGVAEEDLYPIDFERATAKLDSIKDSLVFYSSYPEVQTLLSSGSVSIAVSVTGQFTALMNQGLDVTVQWNEAFLSPNFFVIPVNAPNLENALALAEWMTDPEREAVFIERTLYGPAVSATFDLLDAELIANLPNAPEHTGALYFDEVWRSEHLEDYTNNYTDWLSS